MRRLFTVSHIMRSLLNRSFWQAPRCVTALVIGVVVLLTAVSVAVATHREPPLPSCFESGSGYGTCQGEVIPGGGTVTKLTAQEDSKGDFELTGPAPLQSTKPVSCGSLGCIYNHLLWHIGSGVKKVSGCRPNQSTCKVRVAKRLPTWSDVYVQQNTEPKTLWAIWNSGQPPSVLLSGHTFFRVCAGSEDTRCKVTDVPTHSLKVRATGPGGTRLTTPRHDGSYSFRVRKGGRWKISLVEIDSRYRTDPAEHVVTANRNMPGLDFIRCSPVNNRPPPDCKLVEVTGRTKDINNVPFKLVTVSGDGGSAISDATGHFTLWVKRGPQTLDAEGPSQGQGQFKGAVPLGSVQIDATAAVRNVAITVHPAIDDPPYDSDSAMIPISLAGLPLHEAFNVAIIHEKGGSAPCAPSATKMIATISLRIDRFTFFPPKGQAFCRGEWGALLLSSDDRKVFARKQIAVG